MSKRVTLPGNVVLDMEDPEAIRAHALKVIAEISVQENGFHQTRLAAANRLLELADTMKAKRPAQVVPIDAKAAAAELMRRAEAEKQR